MDTNEIAICFNNQALRFVKNDLGDWIQTTDYVSNGSIIEVIGYGGYDEDIIIAASTRPIANKVYRAVRQ